MNNYIVVIGFVNSDKLILPGDCLLVAENEIIHENNGEKESLNIPKECLDDLLSFGYIEKNIDEFKPEDPIYSLGQMVEVNTLNSISTKGFISALEYDESIHTWMYSLSEDFSIGSGTFGKFKSGSTRYREEEIQPTDNVSFIVSMADKKIKVKISKA